MSIRFGCAPRRRIAFWSWKIRLDLALLLGLARVDVEVEDLEDRLRAGLDVAVLREIDRARLGLRDLLDDVVEPDPLDLLAGAEVEE
ncbi:MAG TPA: hypothetical protein VHF22_00990, partial [Planctomycetota bacterium]|nr:hypothetical protein [Planctomycetota bacterium]